MLTRDVLEQFIDEHNRHREFQYGYPFLGVKCGDLEDGWEWWHVEDHEVEGEREHEGSDEPDVQPWWHEEHGLVLRDTVEGIQQLDDDQYGESHRHWMWVLEDLAVQALEFAFLSQALHVVRQLVPAQMWAVSGADEPPRSREDGGKSDVAADGAVSEQQPGADQVVAAASWWLVHDIEIWWVERERGGWKTVGDQVDPEKLNWDESFWNT